MSSNGAPSTVSSEQPRRTSVYYDAMEDEGSGGALADEVIPRSRDGRRLSELVGLGIGGISSTASFLSATSESSSYVSAVVDDDDDDEEEEQQQQQRQQQQQPPISNVDDLSSSESESSVDEGYASSSSASSAASAAPSSSSSSSTDEELTNLSLSLSQLNDTFRQEMERHAEAVRGVDHQSSEEEKEEEEEEEDLEKVSLVDLLRSACAAT